MAPQFLEDLAPRCPSLDCPMVDWDSSFASITLPCGWVQSSFVQMEINNSARVFVPTP